MSLTFQSAQPTELFNDLGVQDGSDLGDGRYTQMEDDVDDMDGSQQLHDTHSDNSQLEEAIRSIASSLDDSGNAPFQCLLIVLGSHLSRGDHRESRKRLHVEVLCAILFVTSAGCLSWPTRASTVSSEAAW